MKLILTSRIADEQGQASLFLLVGVTLSLFALAVLFFRLGDANEMRTTTQSAADAAALAAVGDIEDRAAKLVVNQEQLPFGVGWQKSSGNPAAEQYAEQNNAELTNIRASDNEMGMTGNIVRVEVAGNRCQRELADDGSVSWNHRDCPSKKEIEEAEKRGETIPTQKGNAAAIAKVTLPECRMEQWPPDGVPVVLDRWVSCRKAGSGSSFERVWTINQFKNLSEAKLVDQEGTWIYSELTGGPGTGRYPCSAVGGQNITRKMCETHKKIMGKWGAVFEKYGVGCYRKIEDGGEHPRGRACDYMVSDPPSLPTPEYKKGADAAAQWMIDNHKELNIYYIMWDHHIWNPSRDPVGKWSEVKRYVEPRGGSTADHLDHIHVSVTK